MNSETAADLGERRSAAVILGHLSVSLSLTATWVPVRARSPAAAVQVMDALNLDVPSRSFDLVAASFVIHVLDDPPAAAAEAYRVLAPGGQFAFTGGSARHHARPGDGPTGSEATSLGRRLNDLFAECAAHLPPGGSMGDLIDAAELLEDAGFVDLREKQAAVAILFADNATLWRWAMSHGYRVCRGPAG
jgi:SAM-dependent methyltransferase